MYGTVPFVVCSDVLFPFVVSFKSGVTFVSLLRSPEILYRNVSQMDGILNWQNVVRVLILTLLLNTSNSNYISSARGEGDFYRFKVTPEFFI